MDVYQITVRQDGSGDVQTIAEAVALAAKYATQPGQESRVVQTKPTAEKEQGEQVMKKNQPAGTTLAPPVEIRIGAGVYRERIELVQSNVTLVGEGNGETKIEYDDYAQFVMPDGVKRGTFRTQTFFIDGDYVAVKNLTFCNSAGLGTKVGQALAMYADGVGLIFENCRFLGRQDTLFTAPLPPTVVQPGGFRGPKENAPRRDNVHYYKNCYIEGDVDFIFGGATAFFEECEICSLNRDQEINGYVTAASTPEGKQYGYVFDRCRFTSGGRLACPPGTVYLGRPWRDFAKVVILNSELGAHIHPEGWHDWKKEQAHTSTFFAEYGNYGPGADTAGRVPWSHQLTEEEAKEYAKERVLTDSQYYFHQKP